MTINRATGVDKFDDGVLPNIVSLRGYPNFFNAVANINYSVPNYGQVNLSIYDLQGRIITGLADGYNSAGIYTTSWSGSERYGNEVVSGIHFIRLDVDSNIATSRLVLLK